MTGLIRIILNYSEICSDLDIQRITVVSYFYSEYDNIRWN